MDFHDTFKDAQGDLYRILNTRQLFETHITGKKIFEVSADVKNVIALLGQSNEREKKLKALLEEHSAADIIKVNTNYFPIIPIISHIDATCRRRSY